MHPSDPVDGFTPRHQSFAEFFLARAERPGEALVELDHTSGSRRCWSAGEWTELVGDTAAGLVAEGVSRGDSVGALLGNRAEAMALAYACWVIGVCYVPLNPHDSTERGNFILRDSRARLLVTTGPVDARLVEGLDLRTVGDVELTTRVRGAVAELAAGDLDQEALRVYTSGTTGEPKGVILTVRNLLTDVDALAQGTGWDETARILTVLPIHHVNGLIISNLLVWSVQGTTVLCDRFRSERFWNDAGAEQATAASLVPSLLEFLLRSHGAPPEGFDEVLCGAGPLLPETALEFETRFDIPVRHLFGMSETTAVVTLMPPLPPDERRRWHADFGFPSIGPALPHAEVTILTAPGHEAREGERGEIAVRGAMVMRHYAGHPSPDGEAWLRTGDEGFWRRAESGAKHFFITGRLKEIIIRGGVNISPVEIDAVLAKHAAVEFGLAVPFANRFYGEEIAAYVVASQEVSADAILAHCHRYLDFARCPKVVVFGDEVPFTATGKPKRIELTGLLSAGLETYRDVQFRRSSLPSSSADHAPGGHPASDERTAP